MGGTAAARAVWLTTPAGPVFAMHHAPSGATLRDGAVVLCRPFGYEAQCTERAYRHLAEMLAAAGFHVLRVDYHGTGDSSGGDLDGDRLGAWVGSARAAIDWCRFSLGARGIALFGARLGALVALKAAAECDVDALVLLAPPLTGRAWLRESRALQAMMVAALGLKGWTSPRDGEESAGFLLTKSTVGALGEIDPAAHAVTARAALVVARDDLPGGEDKLTASLRARGLDVTLSRIEGYGAMIHSDPRKSVVPAKAWAEVTRWLLERLPAAGPVEGLRNIMRGAASTVAEVRENGSEAPVREEAVDIGGLFGVLTEPAFPASADLPTIVLHNSGANSHIGPNRMSVTLARRWAGLGFRVLRFDIAGLGESPADAEIGENQVYSNGTARDSLRALDFLERTRGANRFVCAGLCSGAFFSFHAALADERVVGMMLLNIQLFHWRVGDPVDARKRDVVKSQHFYRKAAFERQAWARLVRGQVDVRSIAQGILHNSWEMARQRVRGALLGESDVARGFRTLLQRGTDVLLVLSADDGARNTVDAHLGVNAARFHRDPRFRIEIIDGADHTFTPLACQDVLVSLLTNHLVTRFGAEPAFAAGDRLPASGPAESVRMTATR